MPRPVCQSRLTPMLFGVTEVVHTIPFSPLFFFFLLFCICPPILSFFQSFSEEIFLPFLSFLGIKGPAFLNPPPPPFEWQCVHFLNRDGCHFFSQLTPFSFPTAHKVVPSFFPLMTVHFGMVVEIPRPSRAPDILGRHFFCRSCKSYIRFFSFPFSVSKDYL